ncbi:MAG: hypothetical protein ACRCY4_05150 [Brevinema sp.]
MILFILAIFIISPFHAQAESQRYRIGEYLLEEAPAQSPSQMRTNSQSKSSRRSTTEKPVPNNRKVTFGFRRFDEDRYFIGWQNPRAFITRFFVFTNFQLTNALLARDPINVARWNFPGVLTAMDARISTEIYLIRSRYVGVLVAGALEIPMLARMDTVSVFAVTGEAALTFEFYLPKDWRIRFTPVFHQSTHLADGFRGDPRTFDLLSYEFMAFELYKRWKWFTFYGGIEITYNSPAERLLRLRMHVGTDFRYPIWNEIGFITGINIGMLYDEHIRENPSAEGVHPAINFAVGFEFSRVMLAIKISYQRPFEAPSYDFQQTKIGIEASFFL